MLRVYKGRKGFFLGMQSSDGLGMRRPGNTSIRELLADRRFVVPVLRFRVTGVGKVKEGVVFSSGAP